MPVTNKRWTAVWRPAGGWLLYAVVMALALAAGLGGVTAWHVHQASLTGGAPAGPTGSGEPSARPAGTRTHPAAKRPSPRSSGRHSPERTGYAASPSYSAPAPASTQPDYTQPDYTQPAYTQPAYTQPASAPASRTPRPTVTTTATATVTATPPPSPPGTAPAAQATTSPALPWYLQYSTQPPYYPGQGAADGGSGPG
jgi:hypothetical protein